MAGLRLVHAGQERIRGTQWVRLGNAQAGCSSSWLEGPIRHHYLFQRANDAGTHGDDPVATRPGVSYRLSCGLGHFVGFRVYRMLSIHVVIPEEDKPVWKVMAARPHPGTASG